MKEAILEAAKQSFGKERLGNLSSVLEEWIGKNETIESFSTDGKNDRILILISGSKYGDAEEKYKLIRLFPRSTFPKWEVSVDYSGQTAQEMMAKLLTEMCS